MSLPLAALGWYKPPQPAVTSRGQELCCKKWTFTKPRRSMKPTLKKF
jgi:hypothetical protein